MPLANVEVRYAAGGQKDRKIANSGGLHLFVTTGHKSWCLRYDFGGKERRLLLGSWPEATLAKAREPRENRDPGMEAHKRKIAAHAAAGATFERCALLWHAAQKKRWSPAQWFEGAADGREARRGRHRQLPGASTCRPSSSTAWRSGCARPTRPPAS